MEVLGNNLLSGQGRRSSLDHSAFLSTGYALEELSSEQTTLWEKATLTRLAVSMRESGESLVQGLGITKGLKFCLGFVMHDRSAESDAWSDCSARYRQQSRCVGK